MRKSVVFPKALNINEDSVSFFLSKLLRDKKIKITGLKVLGG